MKLIVHGAIEEIEIPEGYVIVLNGKMKNSDLVYYPASCSRDNIPYWNSPSSLSEQEIVRGVEVAEFLMVIRKVE